MPGMILASAPIPTFEGGIPTTGPGRARIEIDSHPPANSARLPRMGRYFVILVTVFALAWQSFAAMASTIVHVGRADVVHSVMHWQAIPHHHGHHHRHDAAHDHGDAKHAHADGHDPGDAAPVHHHDAGPGVHVDDSEESQDHLATGHGCPPALVSGILTPPLVPGGIMPGLAPARPEPPALPDGLFRPPRTLA